jgi:hypothetical protein
MKRPIEFYQTAWDTFNADDRPLYKYQKAMLAFLVAGEAHNVPLSGCMTTKAYASSYMMDDVKRKVSK